MAAVILGAMVVIHTCDSVEWDMLPGLMWNVVTCNCDNLVYLPAVIWKMTDNDTAQGQTQLFCIYSSAI